MDIFFFKFLQLFSSNLPIALYKLTDFLNLPLTPIEIKSGTTVSSHYFDSIIYWNSIAEKSNKSFVIYGGDKNQGWPVAQIMSWRNAGTLVKKIEEK